MSAIKGISVNVSVGNSRSGKRTAVGSRLTLFLLSNFTLVEKGRVHCAFRGQHEFISQLFDTMMIIIIINNFYNYRKNCSSIRYIKPPAWPAACRHTLKASYFCETHFI
jgi:hypothetical protein